jgi:hypothetical protein
MAGLLAVFGEFEREILRERAGWSGSRPPTWATRDEDVDRSVEAILRAASD